MGDHADLDPNELARYGKLETADGRWRLVFTRRLPHPPEKVWRAVSEPEHVSQWFPSDIHGERRAGAPLEFVFRENEGPTIAGEMLAFDPPRLLEMRWGDEIIRIELAADEDGSATVVTFHDIFDELGKAARDAAGWHSCLDLLEAHLDGTPRATDRWREVQPRYKELLGPEASTIGPPEGHPDA